MTGTEGLSLCDIHICLDSGLIRPGGPRLLRHAFRISVASSPIANLVKNGYDHVLSCPVLSLNGIDVTAAGPPG